MMPIAKGAAPTSVAAVEASEIARVDASLAQGAVLDRKLVADAYREYRQELRRRQLGKCCYCEWRYPGELNDVEHLRPAVKAHRGQGFTDDGYWWLAWHWPNLFFACATCNRSQKNADFPLAAGSVQLPAKATPPGGEKPLLLDPGTDDPLRHIVFKPVVANGKERWRPFGTTPAGRETIRVLGLDRDALTEEYEAHVGLVEDDIASMGGALAASSAAALAPAWGRLARWLSPTAAFVALAHDLIVYRLGPQLLAAALDPTAELRARWSARFGVPYP